MTDAVATAAAAANPTIGPSGRLGEKLSIRPKFAVVYDHNKGDGNIWSGVWIEAEKAQEIADKFNNMKKREKDGASATVRPWSAFKIQENER